MMSQASKLVHELLHVLGVLLDHFRREPVLVEVLMKRYGRLPQKPYFVVPSLFSKLDDSLAQFPIDSLALILFSPLSP
jgi:hypothetical protein